MRVIVASILIVTVIFGSCSGEPVIQDPIDFDQFAGDTGIEKQDSDNEDTARTLNLSTFSGKLKNALKADYSSDTCLTVHVMDRYSSSSSEKFVLRKNQMVDYGGNKVTPVAELFYYTFSDSNKTNNAFYNFLDDLSANGESEQVQLNQEIEHLKTPPLFMMVYDTVIVAAHLACEHKANDWRSLRDSMLSIYGENHKYFIEVQCGGPLRWK
jgi:hypothetical protein